MHVIYGTVWIQCSECCECCHTFCVDIDEKSIPGAFCALTVIPNLLFSSVS